MYFEMRQIGGNGEMTRGGIDRGSVLGKSNVVTGLCSNGADEQVSWVEYFKAKSTPAMSVIC
jgi:hypothetical protein